MKTKLNIFNLVFALFSITAVQNGTAQAPNSSPAQEALKGMRPFIGNWAGESEAFGGFEGLEEGGGTILWEARFRWLQNKTAVEFTSQTKYKNTDKRFNSASQIMSFNAATGKLRTVGHGHDGSVYWSNTGTVKIDGKSITLTINEITINKTESKYTVKFTKESSKMLSLQLTDAYVDGEKQKDWKVKLHRITKFPRSTQSAVSVDEVEKITEELNQLSNSWSKAALTKNTAFLKSIWADDFSYIDADGTVRDEKANLALYEDDSNTVTSGANTAFNVRVYDKNFAVTDGDNYIAGKDKDGKPFRKTWRWTNVWVRKNGKWKVVAGHASQLE